MSPRLIIVGSIRAQDPAQVRFTEHDDVVQALPSDRADESFNISILPGRSGRDRPVPNAHGAQTPHKEALEDAFGSCPMPSFNTAPACSRNNPGRSGVDGAAS